MLDATEGGRGAGIPQAGLTFDQDQQDEGDRGEEQADEEEIPAEVPSIRPIGRQTHFSDGFHAPAAHPLDGDIRVGPPRDRLDLAVDQTEPDQLGEGPGLTLRRETVEGVAFPADHKTLEP